MKPDKDKPAKPASKTSVKVFDVSRPGKALASPTSRPVIVGHKPEAASTQVAVSGIGERQPLLSAKDKTEVSPLAAAGEQMAETQEPLMRHSLPLTPPSENDLQPSPPKEEVEALATTALAETTEPPEQTAPTLAAKPEPSKTETSSASTPEPLTPAPEEPTPAAATEPPAAEAKTEASAPDDLTATPNASQSAAEARAEAKVAETKPQPAIEPLFDDAGIVVSHHDHHTKSPPWKTIALLLLILILALVALDLALDAGLLTLNGLPHTDLF